MRWLDTKYIGLMSNRLRNYKRKSDSLWNFSCPFCGDSQKHKQRARGYIFLMKDKLLYHCHKCGVNKTVPQVLKHIDMNLYDEYMKESLLERSTFKNPLDSIVFDKPIFADTGQLKKLKKVSQLEPDHFAKKYVVSRMIPSPYHAKLYYTPAFKAWTNTLIPNKFENLDVDDARLVIPLFDKEKNLFGFQGRAFGESKVRYITIMLDERKPRIFNLDTVDFSKRTYIVEGPIDAMFIPNTIASAGGDIVSVLRSCSDVVRENIVVVYDNEPRSKETIKKIKKAIDAGYAVCIWPDDFSGKDINEMVLDRMPVKKDYVNTEFVMKKVLSVENVIDDNIYRGAEAVLRLTQWKRINVDEG
jgi:transcription elongation factor Elf1